jgi:hypothetical protein
MTVRARLWAMGSKALAQQFKTIPSSAAYELGKDGAKRKNKEYFPLDNDDELKNKMQQVDACLVKDIFEIAFPHWKALVRTKGEAGPMNRSGPLVVRFASS